MDESPAIKPSKPNRDWLRILYIIVPYLLIVGTFQYVGMLIAGLSFDKLDSLTTPAQDFITTFFALSGTILTIWLFRRYVDKQSFVSLGFGKNMMAKDILTGMLIGFTIMLISYFGLVFTQQIYFVAFDFKLTSILYSIFFYVFVAITEELLVRGYMLNNLLNSVSKYWALVISAVIFSALHAFNPNINPVALFELFLAGIVLGLAYIYTKSLWFAIGLHFAWNFFQGTIFGFNVSGMEKYNLITITRPRNTIWNGGMFGYEGSVTSMIFQIAAIIIIYLIFNKRKPQFN